MRRLGGVLVLVLVLAVGAFAGSALAQWWQAAPTSAGQTTAAASAPVARIDARVRVEVLNGGGLAGMAREATDVLRGLGFDVVYFGNARSFGDEPSVVLARTGRLDWARAVADALGVREVREEPDENLYLDVTVLLGSEWAPPAPPEPAVVDTVAPWWDLREWFRRRPMAPVGDAKLVDPGLDEDGR